MTVLGERIVPGSSKARFSQFIDRLLSVDSQDAKEKSKAPLSAFEAGSPDVSCIFNKGRDAIQHYEVLTSASAEKHGEAKEGRPLEAIMGDHFENIMTLVADAFYALEPGMKQLGWTDQVLFTSFPGCQESGNNYS